MNEINYGTKEGTGKICMLKARKMSVSKTQIMRETPS